MTEKVEVCGGNCVGWEGRGRERGDEGFRANVRDLDGVWVCPCCGGAGNGLEGGGRGRWKRRRCVDVLDVERFG